jgi:predicted  nucleic acid-binding Zn-ribbon protein
MTTNSPVAQVEVEAKMRKIEAEIDDLKETIKGYENDYKQVIIAARTNLHDLNERIKVLEEKQQGNEPKNPSFHFMFACNIFKPAYINSINYPPIS